MNKYQIIGWILFIGGVIASNMTIGEDYQLSIVAVIVGGIMIMGSTSNIRSSQKRGGSSNYDDYDDYSSDYGSDSSDCGGSDE